ncbi:hypothetical protein AC578_7659 [Pseudocercospora eumusae]|uniref:Hydrophobin n=1 Tax=Pseudocercospora eumusae TaxID=321146 RepID=A0A139GXI9_9PEZI|nr:hypothetical protein AC578_7659 [Pseudocercospora eumusae]
MKLEISSSPSSNNNNNNNIRFKELTKFNHSFHNHIRSAIKMQFTTAIVALLATGALAAPTAQGAGQSRSGSGSGHEGKGSTAIGNGNTKTNSESNICSNQGNAAFCCNTANNNAGGLLSLLGLNGLGGGSCTGLTGGSSCSTGVVMCCPNSAVTNNVGLIPINIPITLASSQCSTGDLSIVGSLLG